MQMNQLGYMQIEWVDDVSLFSQMSHCAMLWFSRFFAISDIDDVTASQFPIQFVYQISSIFSNFRQTYKKKCPVYVFQ